MWVWRRGVWAGYTYALLHTALLQHSSQLSRIACETHAFHTNVMHTTNRIAFLTTFWLNSSSILQLHLIVEYVWLYSS